MVVDYLLKGSRLPWSQPSPGLRTAWNNPCAVVPMRRRGVSPPRPCAELSGNCQMAAHSPAEGLPGAAVAFGPHGPQAGVRRLRAFAWPGVGERAAFFPRLASRDRRERSAGRAVAGRHGRSAALEGYVLPVRNASQRPRWRRLPLKIAAERGGATAARRLPVMFSDARAPDTNSSLIRRDA